MTKFVQNIGWGVAIVIIVILSPLLLLFALEWRPQLKEYREYPHEEFTLPDTLRLLSWNIGYAGLGKEMDFFYDGGEMVRATKERSAENLSSIIAQLRGADSLDFILLQEVDIHSKRSYYVDQAKAIAEALDYPYSAVAINYDSPHVPIPLREPIGRVKAGIMTLSKYPISLSIRLQYPSMPPLPTRLFDLKRCMLSVAIAPQGGDTLWINNTHNSAFDNGELRRREVEFISNIIEQHPRSITAGDWNSTPPDYTPDVAAVENRYFSPMPTSHDDFPMGSSVAADTITSSVRYLDMPYDTSEGTTTVVDFCVAGEECTILEVKTFNLLFENSDHNPVIFNIIVK